MKKLKIVTIGGGSSYTPELLEGFIKRYAQLPVSELWLVDVEEGKEKLDIIYQLCQRMIAKAGIPLVLHKTLDRREALRDADFVTTQLRVGQLQARALDETRSRFLTVIWVRKPMALAGCLKDYVLFRLSLILLKILKNFVRRRGLSISPIRPV